MDIKEQLKQARNKLKQKAIMTAIIAAGILPGKTAEAQTAFPDTIKTSISIDSNQVKHYLNIIPINNSEEKKLRQEPTAAYIDAANAIVYNIYALRNATKDQQHALIDDARSVYNPQTSAHEKIHLKLTDIRQKLYDGTAFMLPSDRIRINLLEEICALKTEKGYDSMAEAVKKFKGSKTDFYSRHYQTQTNSIILALSAESHTPENINKEFTRTYQDKKVNISDKEYIVSLYKSVDNKYQTWLLHDTNDRIVTTADIIKQSSYPIGILCDENMQPLKTDDGQKALASYARYDGQSGNNILTITNIDKETQGYKFPQARANYQKICAEYAAALSLTADEINTALDFLNSLDLEAHNPTDSQISEIRNDYADSSLKTEQLKMKNNYEQMRKMHKEHFKQREQPYLFEVHDPSQIDIESFFSKELPSLMQKALSREQTQIIKSIIKEKTRN